MLAGDGPGPGELRVLCNPQQRVAARINDRSAGVCGCNVKWPLRRALRHWPGQNVRRIVEEVFRKGNAMSASYGLSSKRVSRMPGQRGQQVRYAATAAAALAALLYVLAGTVGSIKLGFCLAMAGAFAVVAVLVFFFSRSQRRVRDLVALFDLGAIVGYFAVAPTRDPHFELWGLAIKAIQVVLLAALGYLIVRDRREPGHG